MAKFCAQCGSRLPDGARFCGECGNAIRVNEQPAPQYEQPAPQYEQPAPQYEQPAPQYEQPTPQYEQPAPQYVQNQYKQPAPQPAPYPQYEQPTPQYAPYPQYAPAPQYAPVPGGPGTPKKSVWLNVLIIILAALMIAEFFFAGFKYPGFFNKKEKSTVDQAAASTSAYADPGDEAAELSVRAFTDGSGVNEEL